MKKNEKLENLGIRLDDLLLKKLLNFKIILEQQILKETGFDLRGEISLNKALRILIRSALNPDGSPRWIKPPYQQP